MRYNVLLILGIVLLSGCNRKVQEFVGMVTPGPNEYQVQTSKRLEVPPHYNLSLPNGENINKQVPAQATLNKEDEALLKEVRY